MDWDDILYIRKALRKVAAGDPLIDVVRRPFLIHHDSKRFALHRPNTTLRP
jgi:hypothetical protein